MANEFNKNKLSDASLESSELDFKNNKEAAHIISQWENKNNFHYADFTPLKFISGAMRMSSGDHYRVVVFVASTAHQETGRHNVLGPGNAGIYVTANQGADFKEFDILKYIPANTTLCLANLCLFKGVWQASNSLGRGMKIHNSFTYTQDINYEPRILELPLENEDFKLVVLVPNEVDLLHTLFRRLTNDGLATSFASVQPLFTTPSILRPPNIQISSETDIKFEKVNTNIIQHGNMIVDDNGASIDVLTCLYISNERLSCNAAETKPATKSPIFFAIIFEDTPIFTGQYLEEI